MSDDEPRTIDDRFEILEVWRRPLIGDGSAAVRVLAKVEAGAYGPEEYAVGISTRPDAQLAPLLDEADLFTGLSFAEAHWVAAVLASAAERVEDAESLLFDLRVPVDLAWRDVDLASEVVEPGGLRSQPLVPWEPEAESLTPGRYAIATYTLDCGHQAVELLRQDPDAAPFWVEDGAVDHLAARDARSLTRLLHRAANLEEAHTIIEAAQANLARHPDDEDEEDDRPVIADWLLWTLSRLIVLPVLYIYPLRMRRRGGDLPRTGPVLIVCNHVSVADPIVLMAAARKRRTSMVAKRAFPEAPPLRLAAADLPRDPPRPRRSPPTSPRPQRLRPARPGRRRRRLPRGPRQPPRHHAPRGRRAPASSGCAPGSPSSRPSPGTPSSSAARRESSSARPIDLSDIAAPPPRAQPPRDGPVMTVLAERFSPGRRTGPRTPRRAPARHRPHPRDLVPAARPRPGPRRRAGGRRRGLDDPGEHHQQHEQAGHGDAGELEPHAFQRPAAPAHRR